jgi:hypothetical protein
VVILLWAWADSLGQMTQWERLAGRGSSFRIFTEYSEIHLYRYRPEDTPGNPAPRPSPGYGSFLRGTIDRDAGMPIFPALRKARTGREDIHGTIYASKLRSIPFWFLLACHLPPWLALSYYYARRRRRRHLASLPV